LSRDSLQPLQQLYYTFWFLDFHWATLLDFWFLDFLVVLDSLTSYSNENYLYKWVGHLTRNMLLLHQQLYYAFWFLDFYWVTLLDFWFLGSLVVLDSLKIYFNKKNLRSKLTISPKICHSHFSNFTIPGRFLNFAWLFH